MNVAVDAMGGDHAPEMVVQGAVDAVSELGIDITLVGHADAVICAGKTHLKRVDEFLFRPDCISVRL